jgi:hypothetical protein
MAPPGGSDVCAAGRRVTNQVRTSERPSGDAYACHGARAHPGRGNPASSATIRPVRRLVIEAAVEVCERSGAGQPVHVAGAAPMDIGAAPRNRGERPVTPCKPGLDCRALAPLATRGKPPPLTAARSYLRHLDSATVAAEGGREA